MSRSRCNDIKVERNGPYIIISAKYEQTVDVFGYKYTYHFDKKVEKAGVLRIPGVSRSPRTPRP